MSKNKSFSVVIFEFFDKLRSIANVFASPRFQLVPVRTGRDQRQPSRRRA